MLARTMSTWLRYACWLSCSSPDNRRWRSDNELQIKFWQPNPEHSSQGNTTRNSMNTKLPTEFFYWYFTVIFTERINSLAKTVGIYWGNPRQNIKNFKKQRSAITWKFLWVILPTELQMDSNQDVRTITCPLQRHNCWQIHKHKYSVDDSIGKS
jgi:hypothetical protein